MGDGTNFRGVVLGDIGGDRYRARWVSDWANFIYGSIVVKLLLEYPLVSSS